MLSLFGATTFRDTFERENTSPDMERYLADAFTPDQQATEIADSAGAVLLAEHISESGDAELVGYAHLVPGDAPEAVRGAAPLELKRLYVARAWHGHRVAQGLMDATVLVDRPRFAAISFIRWPFTISRRMSRCHGVQLRFLRLRGPVMRSMTSFVMVGVM